MAVSDAGGDAQASFDALTIGLSRMVGMMRVLHSDPAQEWTDEQINAFGELMNDCMADTVKAWGALAADLRAVELRDSDAHERMRQEINTALALKCLTMAENGSAVELKCTSGGWVELRVVPRDGEPPFTYNGRPINEKTELERRN